MLRIGYYLAAVDSGLKSGGGTPYAWRVLNTLLASTIPFEFHLFITAQQRQSVELLCQSHKHRRISYSIIYRNRLLELIVRPFEQLVAMRNLKKLQIPLKLANYLEWQMIIHKIDIVHFPVPNLPVYNWRRPIIITMHDVQELHFPEFFSPSERASRALHYWWALESSTNIVVSYDHVKLDLIRYFNMPPEKVHVCPLPVEKSWIPTCDEEHVKSIRRKYQINREFLLYPAQTWQHKNHIRLIQGIVKLRDEGKFVPLLICTGEKNSFYATIEEELNRNRLENDVRFVGIISDNDLAALYKQCRGVIIPTLYEAGSFPLMEAMMLGIPVMCARTTSLPDTIGDTRFTFDALDIDDIARALQLLMVDEGFRQDNIENSRQRVEALAEQHTMTLEAFTRLYLRTNTNRATKNGISSV